jgi:hypothetical protein
MGTHNRLLAIGSARFPRAYLEIIAIDPAAAAPSRRRWFDLDEPTLRTSLARDGPRLVHWVVRTNDLDAQRRVLLDAALDPGPPIAVTRGELRWRITVRDDGRLLGSGAVPTLIEWDPASAHPSDTMAPSAVVLQSVALCTAAAAQLPAALLPDGVQRVDAAAPALCASFESPRGPMTLASR